MIRRVRARRGRLRAGTELNITAFMNLMVVLVPFLLITAVFSRVAILDLHLPPPSGSGASPAEGGAFHLEVVLHPDRLDVGDRAGGLIRRFPRRAPDPAFGAAAAAAGEGAAGPFDFAALNRLVQELKARHPGRSDATLLAAPDVPYDLLVRVMDAVRAGEVSQDGQVRQTELFPDIAIGDAPVGARP